jgi:hypothetical protein
MTIKIALLCAGLGLLAVQNASALEKAAPAKQGTAGVAGPVGGNGTVVAGLPDLMGTTLGFAISGYTAWGQTAVVEASSSQIKKTKAGANQDLCLIGTGLYRTFNKGDVAAGSFIDIVYRNGTPIYTRQVASLGAKQTVEFQNQDLPFQEGLNVLQVHMDAGHNVAESNESNIFEVKVMVKADCNGDGKIAGSPQIKNPSPSTPQKTPTGSLRQN